MPSLPEYMDSLVSSSPSCSLSTEYLSQVFPSALWYPYLSLGLPVGPGLWIPWASPRIGKSMPSCLLDGPFFPIAQQWLIKTLSESHSIMGLNQTCSEAFWLLHQAGCRQLLVIAFGPIWGHHTAMDPRDPQRQELRRGSGSRLGLVSISKHWLSMGATTRHP